MTLLSIKDIEQIAASLAKQRPSFNQLICDFTKRPEGILEDCLNSCMSRSKGKERYPNLAAKASILFYSITKKQPFALGNKRIALAAFLYFLSVNNKWIEVDQEILIELTQWVSMSPVDAEVEVVIYIEKFVKKHLVDL